jgi:hypothetical protein
MIGTKGDVMADGGGDARRRPGTRQRTVVKALLAAAVLSAAWYGLVVLGADLSQSAGQAHPQPATPGQVTIQADRYVDIATAVIDAPGTVQAWKAAYAGTVTQNATSGAGATTLDAISRAVISCARPTSPVMTSSSTDMANETLLTVYVPTTLVADSSAMSAVHLCLAVDQDLTAVHALPPAG